MRRIWSLIIMGAATLMAAGCKEQPAPLQNTVAAPVAENVMAPVNEMAASTDFSPETVPITTASLPPPPFFTVPEGLTSIYDEKDKVFNFGEQIFLAGDKTVRVEGKIYRDQFLLDGDRKYTSLEFLRNYENAILALGGKKINTSQWTYPLLESVGGDPVVGKINYGAAPVPDYPHDVYMIRTADKEYWIDISVGSFPLHGFVVVVEKQTMKQSVGFLDADAMKKAIDTTGRVALQINFDIDKATIRPDAQPILTEIQKLLAADPALKLSIEGHTDNTGDAAHNRQLSTARARSVLGALVGLGIDPARLTSSGFGPDKPVADNGTEDGRAKNRRVELVKR